MFIPRNFREEDRLKMSAFLKLNNFPTIVSNAGERPIATHTPDEVAENENSNAGYKLSQNRNDEDHENIIRELNRRGDADSVKVASAMREKREESKRK